jgi:hypothetical protein
MLQAWFLYLWVIIIPIVLSAIGTNQLSASKGSMWPVPISCSSREKDWGLHLCIAFDLHRFYADSCRSSLPHSHHDANGQRLCILRRAMPCGTAIRSKNVLGNLVQCWAQTHKPDPVESQGPDLSSTSCETRIWKAVDVPKSSSNIGT